MTVKGSKQKNRRAVGKGDNSLGMKIRVRRVEARMSQAQLGNELGVSFQQVQKYEKGTNRVSAVRLQEIAKALGEELSYFNGPDTPATSALNAMLADNVSQRLLRAFSKIEDQQQRYKLVRLVETMVNAA